MPRQLDLVIGRNRYAGLEADPSSFMIINLFIINDIMTAFIIIIIIIIVSLILIIITNTIEADSEGWLTANLRTKILDFRGLDTSIILIMMGGNLHVHRGCPGKSESTNLIRDNLSRNIGSSSR